MSLLINRSMTVFNVVTLDTDPTTNICIDTMEKQEALSRCEHIYSSILKMRTIMIYDESPHSRFHTRLMGELADYVNNQKDQMDIFDIREQLIFEMDEDISADNA